MAQSPQATLVDWVLSLSADDAAQTLESFASNAKKNIESLDQSLDSVIKKRMGELRIANEKAMSGFGQFAGMAKWGAAAVGVTAGAYARSGMQDTVQGQTAAAYNQMLSYQMAAIYAPLVEEKTRYVAQMTSWLRDLSEPQKEAIRSISMFAAAVGTMSFILPKVVSGLTDLAISVRAAGGITELIRSLAMSSSIAGALGVGAAGAGGSGAAAGAGAGAAGAAGAGALALLGPIAVVVGGFIALLMATENGRDALMSMVKAFEPLVDVALELFDAFRPIIDLFADAVRTNADLLKIMAQSIADTIRVFGALVRFTTKFIPVSAFQSSSGGPIAGASRGFEDIDQTFNRLNEAAMRVDLAQQQLQETKNTNDILMKILQAAVPVGVNGAGAALPGGWSAIQAGQQLGAWLAGS